MYPKQAVEYCLHCSIGAPVPCLTRAERVIANLGGQFHSLGYAERLGLVARKRTRTMMPAGSGFPRSSPCEAIALIYLQVTIVSLMLYGVPVPVIVCLSMATY